MRTRYGASYWLGRYPKARQPNYVRLRGSQEADVAVVGGGFAGCAAAYALAVAGARVILLEADRVGQGSTGGCPGLLRLEPPASFSTLRQRLGLARARVAWQATRKAGLECASTIRRLRTSGEFVSGSALRIGLESGDEPALVRDMQAMRAAGVEGTWVTPARLKQETGLTGVGAIRSQGDGYLDPYRVALALAEAAVKRQAQVFERSAVTRVKATRQGVDLTTEGGHVHAEWVVMAVNDVPKMCPALRRHFSQMESYCVLTEVLPSFARREFGPSRALLVDQCDPPLLVRRTADNRLLGMGADGPRLQTRAGQKAVVQRTAQLMYEMCRLYPGIAGVSPEYGWRVPVSVSPDGLPVVGPHRMYPRHLFMLGLGHGGMTAAWLAARTLVRYVQGVPTADDRLFGFSRLR